MNKAKVISAINVFILGCLLYWHLTIGLENITITILIATMVVREATDFLREGRQYGNRK